MQHNGIGHLKMGLALCGAANYIPLAYGTTEEEIL
jgi:hypothetical protein